MLTFSMFCGTTLAKTKSGKCGKNVKWTLTDKGVLTISGKGAMCNYSKKPAPWYLPSIKSLIIKQGVTTVGENAFDDCANLKKVSFPKKGLTKISKCAFCMANIKNITIPKSVKSIGTNAIGYCYSGYLDYAGRFDGQSRMHNMVIKGYQGSAAQKYAKKNGFKFVKLKK